MNTEERCTKRLTILLPPSAYQELRQEAFKREVPVSALVKKALFKRDGSMKR